MSEKVQVPEKNLGRLRAMLFAVHRAQADVRLYLSAVLDTLDLDEKEWVFREADLAFVPKKEDK